VTEMRQKATAYNMPNDCADGMDLLAVRAATEKAIAHCRSGQGPYFLEVVTYRYRGHSMGDQRPYRTQDEIKKWQANDPIGKFQKVLLNAKVKQSEIDAIDKESAKIVDEAVQFAEESPAPGLEELWTDIYVEN